MDQFISSYKKSKNLHHAYFLVGDKETIFDKLVSFLEKEVKVKISSNPDFVSVNFHNLTIDEARDVVSLQERKSFGGEKSLKIFIIQTDFITEEAQNSLLKVFEEPTPGTHFFIISPQDNLLPTLRSRLTTIFENSKESLAESVLSFNLAGRLLKVKEITEEISDEEKTKQDAIEFLNQIESELYKNGSEHNAKSLEVCEKARASLYDRGAPVKIILENVMLSI